MKKVKFRWQVHGISKWIKKVVKCWCKC
jgi:hypothetical protein